MTAGRQFSLVGRACDEKEAIDLVLSWISFDLRMRCETEGALKAQRERKGEVQDEDGFDELERIVRFTEEIVSEYQGDLLGARKCEKYFASFGREFGREIEKKFSERDKNENNEIEDGLNE